MITFFTIPHKFDGPAGARQRTAITSWLQLQPQPTILLFGVDESVVRCAIEFEIAYSPIECNVFGTPLVNDAFWRAEAYTPSDIFVFVNPDIVLLQDFMDAVRWVERLVHSPFVMVGQRWDLELQEPLTPAEGWQQNLRQLVKSSGVLHQVQGIDYFAFRRGAWGEIPPFAVGRSRYDNWLVWSALQRGVPVIDATAATTAVHLNHDHAHITSDVERLRNDELVRLSGGRLCSIADAQFVLTSEYTLVAR